jgi:hypothetical protein
MPINGSTVGDIPFDRRLAALQCLVPKREITTLVNAIEQGQLEKALTPADQDSVPHRESGAYA